jgi:dTDP-4-amino-4,6-dideoxygalactose transaminase
MMISRVKPFIKPEWSDYLKNYLINNYKFGDISIVEKLERKVCEFVSSKFAVAVNSATNAILLILLSLDLKEGDEIILPNYGHPAALNCVRLLKLTPVLVDIKEETLSLDLSKVDCNDRTRAIIQIQSNACMSNDSVSVKKFCELHNIVFIEDSSPSFGQKYYDLFAGTIGDFGVFSLSETKSLFAGEGAVIVTNDRSKYKKLKDLRYVTDYNTPTPCANFNLSPLLAAYVVPQFDTVKDILNKREEIHQKYIDEGIEVYSCPGVTDYYPTIMYLSNKPQETYDKLKNFQIETRYKYYPLFSDVIGDTGLYPVSEFVRRKLIDLPFYMDMTDGEIRAVANLIKMVEK